MLVIIIIKARAELETTRKKAFPVGGLKHSYTGIRPHENPNNVQHSLKKTKKLSAGQINQMTVNCFLKILKTHSVKKIPRQGIP